LIVTEHSADQGSEANNRADNVPSIVPGLSNTAAEGSSGEATGPHEPAAISYTGKDASTAAHNPSKIMILWPERSETSGGASFDDHDTSARKHGARASLLRRRRSMAMAAVVVVAAICGAAGGSLATFALGQYAATAHAVKTAAAVDETAPLKDAVARINADVNGIKADLDRAGKTRSAQLGKLGERLDKMEKSQEDTSTKVAKIGEAQEKADKLRTAAAAAPPAPETTGSITAAAAKTDAKKTPPIVDGWTLTRVSNGGAIIDGPMGLYEAYPGDPLPGLGRVDAVRYQDGRWVVVTQKGLIIRR
jgi:hypothetical protein